MTTLVWFRQDLRLQDNPALFHAVERSDAVVPVFIWNVRGLLPLLMLQAGFIDVY